MERTLTTVGTGSASGTPDALRISAAVVVHGRSVSDALTRTASGVTAVGEVARGFTTDDRVSSSGLQVWPAYDNDGRQVGYEARHSLSISCTGLEEGGKLVMALGDLQDRVRIEGFEPVIEDTEPLSVQAREKAWGDARRKAEELAALAGARVGDALAIVEGGAPVAPVARLAVAEMAKDSSMPIEAGAQVVSATLTVTWGLG